MFNFFPDEMGKQHFEVNIRSSILRFHLENKNNLRMTSIWPLCKWNKKQHVDIYVYIYDDTEKYLKTH